MNWYMVKYSLGQKTDYHICSHDLELSDLIEFMASNQFVVFENELYLKKENYLPISDWDAIRTGVTAFNTKLIVRIDPLSDDPRVVDSKGKRFE